MDKVITPVGTLSFPALFNMVQVSQNNPEKRAYKASLIFDPGADLSELHTLVNKALAHKFPNGAPQQWRTPIRPNSDPSYVDKAGYKERQAGFFISAKNDRGRPEVVDRSGQPVAPEYGNTDIVYPGCRVRLCVSAYGYDYQGNRGVSLKLLAVQWCDDGPRLSVDDKVDASEVFGTYGDGKPADASPF